MLFYVNVQNKTKYKYHGYNDDGNYASVGDVVETQRKYDTTVVMKLGREATQYFETVKIYNKLSLQHRR